MSLRSRVLRCRWTFIPVAFAACILTLASFAAAAGDVRPELRAKLEELDALRNNSKTPFARAEQMAAELSRQYDTPAEQGQIYYTLAGVFAGTSFADRDKPILYARKALAFDLSPVEKARAYIYLGDGLQNSRGRVHGAALVAVRAQAADAYLHAVDVMDKYKPTLTSQSSLPNTKIKPATNPLIRHDPVASTRSASEIEADFTRDSAVRCLSYMYSQMPFQTDELRQMAGKIVEDKASAEQVVAAVQAEIDKRLREDLNKKLLKLPLEITDPKPPKATIQPQRRDAPTTPPPSGESSHTTTPIAPAAQAPPASSAKWTLVIIAALAMIVLFAMFMIRRRRARYGPGPRS